MAEQEIYEAAENTASEIIGKLKAFNFSDNRTNIDFSLGEIVKALAAEPKDAPFFDKYEQAQSILRDLEYLGVYE